MVAMTLVLRNLCADFSFGVSLDSKAGLYPGLTVATVQENPFRQFHFNGSWYILQ